MDFDKATNSSSITLWLGLIVKEATAHSELTVSPWIAAAVCSALVGLSGLFPVLLLSFGKTNTNTLRFMLSFACGGLLGDVFLHLLPEAYETLAKSPGADPHAGHLRIGLWILLGILTFIVVEMMMSSSNEDQKGEDDNGNTIKISGYLNLVANCIDNFAHGLAVGGAFLIDNKTGFITTVCILCHEIPHEIGDFAILMKSGFTKYYAARAQLYTASLGIMGAMVALALDSFVAIDCYTSWIIPFTSGGFLHISLVTVLPDLMKSDTAGDAFRVLTGIVLGISAMMAVSNL